MASLNEIVDLSFFQIRRITKKKKSYQSQVYDLKKN